MKRDHQVHKTHSRSGSCPRVVDQQKTDFMEIYFHLIMDSVGELEANTAKKNDLQV